MATKLRDVRAAELDYIVRRRARVSGGAADDSSRREAADTLVGVALSGGGIRSATTNLGILQGLSRMGILPVVDYVSTVSGGGYIGACMAALLSVKNPKHRSTDPKHAGHGPFDYLKREHLWFTSAWPRFPFNSDRRSWGTGQSEGPLGRHVISHLRTHGNFLIARRGLFRRDALRSIGHLLTGTLYNLVMCLLTLFALTGIILMAAHSLTSRMEERLGKVDMRRTTADSDTRIRSSESTVPFLVVETTTRSQPVDRLFEGFTRFGADARAHMGKGPFKIAAALGAGVTLAMLLFIGLTMPGERWPKHASPGLSMEDTFETAALKVAALALGAAAVAASVYAGLHREGTGIAFLLVPLVVFAAARVFGLAAYVLLAAFRKVWERRLRSVWGAFQALSTYGIIAGLLFICLPIASYAARDGASLWVITAPVVSLVLGRVLVGRALSEGTRFRLPTGVLHFLLGLFAFIVIAFLAVSSGGLGLRTGDYTSYVAVVTIVAGATLLFANINKVGPHYFYRDRLLETYLRTEYGGGNLPMSELAERMEMRLTELHGNDPARTGDAVPPGNTSPYLLISAAINLAGSRDLTRKDRKSGYFLFSKYYCGSTHTGFQKTEKYRGGGTRLGRAITISGAAAATGMGQNTFFAQSFFMALFNLRLGYWMANPARDTKMDGIAIWPMYLVREMFGLTNERTRLVNLSDGGHTGDNVGIYPLLQRRCQVIIACDAERDTKLSFGSFTEALRHAYIDLNVDIDIDLDMIRPDPQTGYSRSHCAVGRIRYRECPDRPNWLIYMKNSLTGDEPAPVLNYKGTCPDFPHESTNDQFFDDAQFESYRALGVHIAEDTFASWTSDPAVAERLRARSPFAEDGDGSF